MQIYWVEILLIYFKVMEEAVHWPMSETEVSILTAPHPITFCRDQLSALCCHYISLPMQTRKVWKTSWLVWKFWLLLPGIHPLANAVCMAISCKLHTHTLFIKSSKNLNNSWFLTASRASLAVLVIAFRRQHFWKICCISELFWNMLFKLDQTWSNLIELDQNGLNWFKLDQIGSKWIKLVQTWSNLIKLDQTWSNWIQMD